MSKRRWVAVLVASIVVVGCVGVVVAATSGPDREHVGVADSRSGRTRARSTTSTEPSSSSTTPAESSTTAATTSTTAVPPPPSTAAPTTVAAVRSCAPVQQLSVDQQAHLVMMVGVGGGDIAVARGLLSGATPVGGIFIGGSDDRMFVDGSLRRLADSVPSLVAVDEEGGRVQRIDHVAGPIPSAAQQASMSAASLRALASARARALRSYGVDVDFAPVVDLADPTKGGVIGDRSFGTDPDSTILHARAFLDGLIDGGVVPTLKHFPGHGSGSGDSHTGRVTTPPLAELEQHDLVPYRQLADSDRTWVMVGHLDVPGLTEPGLPASLSPAAYRYLRDNIGFHGLAVTDELGGMKAVRQRFSAANAGVQALRAGADVILYADDSAVASTTNAIVAAVRTGSLPAARLAEAAGRVRRAQGC